MTEERRNNKRGFEVMKDGAALFTLTDGLSDRDLLRQLYPILFGVEQTNEGTVSDLQAVEFLELDPSIAACGTKAMMIELRKQLGSVFFGARYREAEKIPVQIRTLTNQLDLRDNERLRIFFAVPNPRYKEFVTNPVNPLYDPVNRRAYQDLMNVEIFHVGVSGEK